MFKLIYESSSIVQHIRIWLIGCELIHQFRKLTDVLLNSTRSPQTVEMANQRLMRITPKTMENCSTKIFPRSSHEFVLHRGKPTRGCSLKLHRRHRNPEIRIGVKHFKVIDRGSHNLGLAPSNLG